MKVSAVTKLGIKELIEAVVEEFEEEHTQNKLLFSEAVEEEIVLLEESLKKHRFEDENSYRNIAINLLKGDKKLMQSFMMTQYGRSCSLF